MVSHSEVSDLNFEKLFEFIKKKKFFIIGITTLFFIISLSISIIIPNTYKSTVLLTSSASSGNQLSSTSSGLAGLAGIGLGDVLGDNTKLEVGIEMMQSFNFFENFINKEDNFFNLIAIKGWDKEKNILIIDKNIYDEKNKKWVSNWKYAINGKPSLQEAHEKFIDSFDASLDISTGIVSVSFRHYSPYISRNFVEKIVQEINKIARDEVINTSQRQIEYLEIEMVNNQYSELKQGISDLIEGQIEKISIANASPDYLFRVISKPYAPEKHDSPARIIIVILSSIFSFMSSILWIAFTKRKLIFS
tara:strand:+ start:104 stop:1018 length:915 start_codon:yes stop_codon:yes gene_type:complete